MSTLTPAEFMAHCDEEVQDAVDEYANGTVSVDRPDSDGDEVCARCDLPVWLFPTKCLPYGDGHVTFADTRVYGVKTDINLTFQWTVYPDCSAALAEWVETRKEALHD